eukprot:6174957-Pleurochrysis_carterae.AAC.1
MITIVNYVHSPVIARSACRPELKCYASVPAQTAIRPSSVTFQGRGCCNSFEEAVGGYITLTVSLQEDLEMPTRNAFSVMLRNRATAALLLKAVLKKNADEIFRDASLLSPEHCVPQVAKLQLPRTTVASTNVWNHRLVFSELYILTTPSPVAFRDARWHLWRRINLHETQAAPYPVED